MGLIQSSDITRLLQDDGFKADIAQAVVEDHKLVQELADEIADELEDALEDDAALRGQIIDAAMQSPEFKQKLVSKIIQDLG